MKTSQNRQNKIHYSLAVAMSLDGKITKGNSKGSDWTSPEDKKFLHKHLDKADVILIGRKTYEVAEKYLSERKCLVFTRNIGTPKILNRNAVLFNPEQNNIEKYLQKNHYNRAVILGGTEIYSYFLEHNLVDEIYLTVEPLIFGSGLSLTTLKIPLKKRLKLESVKKLNSTGTLLLKYKV